MRPCCAPTRVRAAPRDGRDDLAAFVNRRTINVIPTITAFKWVPTFARGFVRDIRVRWALEEAGQAYAVDCVDGVYVKSQAHRHFQPFGQIPT